MIILLFLLWCSLLSTCLVAAFRFSMSFPRAYEAPIFFASLHSPARSFHSLDLAFVSTLTHSRSHPSSWPCCLVVTPHITHFVTSCAFWSASPCSLCAFTPHPGLRRSLHWLLTAASVCRLHTSTEDGIAELCPGCLGGFELAAPLLVRSITRSLPVSHPFSGFYWDVVRLCIQTIIDVSGIRSSIFWVRKL